MPGQVRSVSVRLSANTSGYIAGMGAADKATDKVGRGLGRLESRGKSVDRIMRGVGTAGKVLGLGAVAGIGLAVKTGADFEAKMSQVKSLTHATAGEMDQLTKAAKNVGLGIGVTASESADAQIELVKAGVSLKDILGGGLKGALDLAAAGQTDVGTSAEIASSAMVQFGLAGKDIPHVADLLAAGADKALGGVTDLGYGLSQVGTTANQMGFSIEETVGTLAEFASAGLIGEKGGTTLKSMFLQLAAPTKQAKDLMDKYNLSLYDSQGKMKPVAEIAGNLQRSFKDLDPATRNAALGVIFGSRAIQGANILLKDGEATNRKWTASVNDQGFAAEQAAGKMDNLKGDAKKLKAQLENALIGKDGKNSFLRGLAQDATDLVKKYNELTDAQKSLFGKAVVGAAATGGALYTASKIYSLAKSTREIYTGLRGGAKIAKAAGGVAEGLGDRIGRGVTPVYVTNPGFGSGVPGTGTGTPGTPVVAAAKGGLASTVKNGGAYALAAYAGLQAVKEVGSQFDELHRKLQTNNEDLTSQGQIYKKLKDSNVGKYADDLNINLKELAADIAVNGSSGSRVRDAQKKMQNVGDYAGGTKGYLNSLVRGFAGSGLAPNLAGRRNDTQGDFKDVLKGADSGLDVVSAKKAAQELKSVYASLPKAVRTKIEVPGSNETIGVVSRLAKQYHLTPRQIQTIFETRGDSKATAKAKTLKVMLRSLPKGVQTEIKQRGGEVTRQLLLDLQRKYKLTPEQVQTLIALKGMDKARGEANSLLGLLASITRPRTSTVTLITRKVTEGSPTGNPTANKPYATNQATGALYQGGRRYSRGGVDVANRHLPELFGPGTRIFAEPETKGEAYIPLADDWRRPRARMLTAQTAALLGGRATFNAAGSVTGHQARRGSDGAGPRSMYIAEGRLELPDGYYATVRDVHLIADEKLADAQDTQRGREVRGGH